MDDDEEMKQQLFQAIVESFNKIGMMAMNQLANGNDGFTLTNGPWTVTLDLQTFLENANKIQDKVDNQPAARAKTLQDIVNEKAKIWHERLKSRGKNK